MSPGRVTDRFADIVGELPTGVWSAPGRVNIIGEHTDYNGGFALPIAIDRRTSVAVGIRHDGLVRVGSALNDDVVTVELARCVPGSVSGWSAYPLGVLWALGATRGGFCGLDIVIDTDVPIGAGLSSSAAIECAVAVAVNDVWELELDRLQLAYAAQRAENDMVGAPTGIMDHIASLFGEADAAVFVDCQVPDTQVVPFVTASDGIAVLVINSMVQRVNATGGYARRRASCERAAHAMGAELLRDLAPDDLPRLRELVDDETFRRARHVVTENVRVREAVELLNSEGVREIGDLLVASHLSMRDDFEISVPHIDLAVRVALDHGALGARLTGGGFGGAAIALVPSELLPLVEHELRSAFATSNFDAPQMFVVTPSDGAMRLD